MHLQKTAVKLRENMNIEDIRYITLQILFSEGV